eukprot:scaffold7017_cov134-Cylindrotheca_fusiformis.AAC.18
MEVSIHIPQRLVEIWDVVCFRTEVVSALLLQYASSIWGFVTYQWNSLLLMLSIVFFWPMWVYIGVTLTTASTWIFWLIASLLLGILQMIYVAYQFIMIATDVMVLSCLKTYQVLMRSGLTQFVFFFSKTLRNKQIRTSRRQKWRNQCEFAKDYEEFLKIPVLEPKGPEEEEGKQPHPLKKRTHSFATMQTLYEEQDEQASRNMESPLRRNHSLKRVRSFSKEMLETDDALLNIDANVVKDLGEMTAKLLKSTMLRLKDARKSCALDNDLSSLEHLLCGVVKRNHLTLEDLLVNNARSVAYSGQHEFSSQSRALMEGYYSEVSKGLDYLAEAPLSKEDPRAELADRMTLIRKMKQNTGRTALMLSGGGAQAMYHLGTIRALIDADLYDDIKVVSGTSGGSITAACCAMHTTKEILDTICVPTVSTDYRLNGEMKEKNIKWFPPIQDMVAYWLKCRLLVDSELWARGVAADSHSLLKYFYRTCEFYYGTTTFAEAFERTGKHVCITVSASRATGGTAQRLLLNHISTPHVTLASAVAASCALPGVMKPAKLQTKSSLGELEPFEVDGVDWIDGSVQADLPFQRISTLFNVSNYIVCQTNFHVQPFLNKDHHPSTRSAYWKLFQLFEWDIRNRALKLGRLGLFPKIFGQDISKVFKQKYHGNLTLVPRFTAAQTFGLKALVNPSVKDMEGYLKYGQLAAWPYVRCVQMQISAIRDMIRLEKSLDMSLDSLRSRCNQFSMDMDISDADDLDSIASGGTSLNTGSARKGIVRFATHQREVETLSQKLTKVEMENRDLRQQVQELEKLLGRHSTGGMGSEEKKAEEDKLQGHLELSEGRVWNIMRKADDRTPPE